MSAIHAERLNPSDHLWDHYPPTRSGYRVQIEGQKPIAV
jgi:hypothetical protein